MVPTCSRLVTRDDGVRRVRKLALYEVRVARLLARDRRCGLRMRDGGGYAARACVRGER